MVAKLFAIVSFGILLCAIAIALFAAGVGNLMEGLEPVMGSMDFGILEGILDAASDLVRGLLL